MHAMRLFLSSIKRRVQQIFERILTSYWAARRPRPRSAGPTDLPVGDQGGPPPAVQRTDNLMRTMNLIMPLADPTPVGRAQAAMAIGASLDEIYSGLDNVGTVHHARFDIIGDSLCMYSFYDGDFETYIRDFIVTIGHAFNAVMRVVVNPPRTPCQHHVEEFIDWVHDHDAIQFPDDISALSDEVDDIADLGRAVVMMFHDHENVQLGSYRGYPGFSVAQIREQLGVGW